mgnify:CR=1 FL=1
MTKLEFISFVKKYCDFFGICISQEDLIEIVNILIMQNDFIYFFKRGSLESSQVRSYIVYAELIKRGYEISSNTYGETDSDGYLE